MKLISITSAAKLAGFSSPNAFHHWADYHNNTVPDYPVFRIRRRVDADSLEKALERWGLRRGSVGLGGGER